MTQADDVAIELRVPAALAWELAERAATEGLTAEELAEKLLVIAFRTADLPIPYSTFWMPDACAGAFIADGFRVLRRVDGWHQLGPAGGMSFERAAEAVRASIGDWTEAEILAAARS